MHFHVYGLFYLQFSHQHVSAAITAIFRVTIAAEILWWKNCKKYIINILLVIYIHTMDLINARKTGNGETQYMSVCLWGFRDKWRCESKQRETRVSPPPYGWYLSTNICGGHVSGDKNLIQSDSCKHIREVSASVIPYHTATNIEDEHKLSLKCYILFKNKIGYKFGTLQH
jgi:hypothetical protein